MYEARRRPVRIGADSVAGDAPQFSLERRPISSHVLVESIAVGDLVGQIDGEVGVRA